MILLLIILWYSVLYWLLNDIRSIIDSLFIFSHNEIKYITPKTGNEGYKKLHDWLQQPFVSKPQNYPNWDFWTKNGAVGLPKRLWAGRSQCSNNDKCEFFLCPPKRPDWLGAPHKFLVSMNWTSSPGIKRPGFEPNNSPPSSVKVMLLSTKFPLVFLFQLNEQQKVKAVRVSGTDKYCKEWVCGSADWYSAVG
jgi:hypothetical protein